MWRNYLTVGLRSLMKNRTYAFINILGLAIGMAACLMILLFVRYEFSYDKWLPDSENVYQVQTYFKNPDSGELSYGQMSTYTSEAALRKDFPQIIASVYVLSSEPVFYKDGQASSTENYRYVNGDLLATIPLPLVAGDKNALGRVGDAILSETEAMKRFGTTNVVGKTFTVISKGKQRDFRVTGVFKDIPKNSSFAANMIGRMDFPSFFATEPGFLDCWGCNSGWVYVRLKPGSDVKTIEAQMPAWEKRNIPDQNSGEARFNAGDFGDWHLVNIRDVHLGKAQDAAVTPGNDKASILTFAVIAILILGMAVVNFTNLSTARASQRAREVALRKVLGATRKQLIIQFIGESVIVTFLAMVIALAVVELAMPAFSAFLKADIQVHYFGADGILLPVLLLVAVVGVLGGLYPAFFISRFQPASVLRANKSSAETPGSGRLRQVLVVGQFAVSIGLIICTAVIYAQTVYARTVDPGYKRDHILQIGDMNRYQLLDKGEMIEERARRVPGVDAVGRTSIGIATESQNNTGVMLPGRKEPVTIGNYVVDPGFLDAMGLKLVAGRWFDEKRPLDDMSLPFPPDDAAQQALAARGANVVVNEYGAQRLGYRNPADIVGKTFRAALVDNKIGLVPVTVIGVVGDSRFRSIKQPLDPIMFLNARSGGGHTHMIVRYHGDPENVRRGLEQMWQGVTTEVPFLAKYSDDIVGKLYEAEDARAETFAAFALLSVVVGCLGLFGLAAFTAERRTKEIGIRKVMGARTRDIVRLLVWQFTRPVIIANIIAWPVAWWLMRDWLNKFDARIDLGPTPFVAAGLLALLIAIGTIAAHAIKVASANPIRALRYE
ncbi:FtsX-like permease family protein [Sphingomonas sp. MAH-20]|uniref:FtsX-like permease family protein n=1 Tax=Sphingomonas horti TaxID=2682842 RepID=A0A6I4J1P3_9SPHN|nr:MULTISPECIES: ABC transporter permease [Sphingomonas]MBA2919649.1 ABC transporter permease [Sphingomonas sp. CGMCC 1.13658]MVO78529.1 FtsX-like permease family protein [Sphingomonas horti]